MNGRSGANARDGGALDRAMKVFGPERARLYRWSPREDITGLVERALADGAHAIVAAGGDGTAMAVAGAVLGRGCAFSVLPLGTFNYFARGLGIPEDPEDAARAILDSDTRQIHVGTVNGQVFLNNASLGIYPAILKEREDIYGRYGRRRIMAHWSVIRTFLRFRKPMDLRIETDGETLLRRTPLLFVARSAYQLERYGLQGGDAISDDSFAVLIGRASTRADLFRVTARLVAQTAEPGVDYDFLATRKLTVQTRRRRDLLAYDGEKTRTPNPFEFRISEAPLTILLPRVQEDLPG
ncbi:diacylglycerol kinase family protein [Tropicimonas sp. IMCC6043]|uniref:diacylglycerol/lipid kinase family protein n=1 Tax=Tropicimonas sp. IMCC6043 TaxID=2510645 RepID=UPI001F5E086C|nr:diacylglycerol kinase family protein [Tropicimonas sp. IMCC6043]